MCKRALSDLTLHIADVVIGRAYSSARVAFHSGTVEKKLKYNQLNPAIPKLT